MLIKRHKKKLVVLKLIGMFCVNCIIKLLNNQFYFIYVFNSLPGPEILCKPGKSDGQIIMVNENGKPICYKWLSNECKWDKVGDVLSASNPNKDMYEGKVR